MAKRAKTVAEANERLKLGNIGYGIAIVQRGNRLSLVASRLPRKQNGKATRRISLGLYANEDHLQIAIKRAWHLDVQLSERTFDWSEWDAKAGKVAATAKAVIKEFEEWYRNSNQIQDYQWRRWMALFRRLPQDEPLTVEELEKLAKDKWGQNTPTQQVLCSRLQKLADYANLKVDLLQYKGGYTVAKTKPRKLPSDELIAECFDTIKNPKWRWVYGMMAAYGLRNHEVFFCRFQDDGLLEVLKGKTGPRSNIQGFHPDWIEQWDLREIKRPKIAYRKMYERGALGSHVSNTFNDKLPFLPYDLRHKYAIRCNQYNVGTRFAAAMMGHTAATHLRTYGKDLAADETKRHVADAISRHQDARNS